MFRHNDWVKIIDNKSNEILVAGKIVNLKEQIDSNIDVDFYLISFDDKHFFNEQGTKNYRIEPNEEKIIIEYKEVPSHYYVVMYKDVFTDKDASADVFIEYDIYELDEEVVHLVKSLNNICGLKTIGSCSGHNEMQLWITILFTNFSSIKFLTDILEKKFKDKFVLSTTCNHRNSNPESIVFTLISNEIGQLAYKDAEYLASYIDMKHN